MKFIIFISDIIRQGNFPRVDGFEYSQAYDKYLYAGRELTVGEFNDACVRVFNPDFRNQGFTFRPQAVGPEVEEQIAKDNAEKAAAAEALRVANEAAAEENRKALAAQEAAEAARVAEEAAEAARLAAEEAEAARVAAGAPAPATVDPLPAAEPFLLDGKNIMKDGERIAGLFGDENQLRVSKDHAELRPAIEEWLKSQSI